MNSLSLSIQGVLCPTGCELKKTLLKQERNVKPTVDQLKRSVDELTQSTNSIYGYVLDMTAEVAQRQRVSEGNYTSLREKVIAQGFSTLALKVHFPEDPKKTHLNKRIKVFKITRKL